MISPILLLFGKTKTKTMTEFNIDFSTRSPTTGVDDLFSQRWSPRAFKKTEIPEATLTAIFDAARWSPSCFNEQPWLIVTSSGPENFPTFLDLLVEKNQEWAKDASLIGFIFAKKTFSHNDNPNRFASFDCGAAWMSLTLQAAKFGLYTHGMGGIKKDAVAITLNISEQNYEVLCGFALGAFDSSDAANVTPSTRKNLASVWQAGIKS